MIYKKNYIIPFAHWLFVFLILVCSVKCSSSLINTIKDNSIPLTIVNVGASLIKDFIYLPSGEGLISQFEELKLYWSLNYPRNFYTTRHRSFHFSDVKHYNMCDIFDFPTSTNIYCLNNVPDDVVNHLSPSSCVSTNLSYLKDMTSVLAYRNISAKFQSKITTTTVAAFEMNKTLCLLGGPYQIIWGDRLALKPKSIDLHLPTFPIRFHPKYNVLLTQAKAYLGITHKNYTNYIVAHWRRGDQVHRCHTKMDTSVNCAGPHELIKTLNKFTTKNVNKSEIYDLHNLKQTKLDVNNPPLVIYIATNEKNNTILDTLSSAGYKVLSDIKCLNKLNSVDKFIVEIMLMIDSSYFLAWGVSSIHKFVVQAHQDKNKKIFK